jgi:N utilization substance protein B
VNTRVRHQAREAALSVLYLSEVGKTSAVLALETYFGEHRPDAGTAEREFAEEIVLGTTRDQEALDALIREHSENWRLERLAIVDRVILRMAAWELRTYPDQAPAIVLNEAIELARTFSTDESVKFVNGVLDAVRKTLSGPRPKAQGPGQNTGQDS